MTYKLVGHYVSGSHKVGFLLVDEQGVLHRFDYNTTFKLYTDGYIINCKFYDGHLRVEGVDELPSYTSDGRILNNFAVILNDLVYDNQVVGHTVLMPNGTTLRLSLDDVVSGLPKRDVWCLDLGCRARVDL